MNIFATVVVLATLMGGAQQDQTMEGKAVTRIQRAPASQYDLSLPARPFGTWFNQIVGPQSGVAWHLTECIGQVGAASNGERDIPACVEATAILPDDRKVVAQFFVGFLRQGLSAKTRFHFAVIENDDQLQNVQKLSDLPQILRGRFPAKWVAAVTLPDMGEVEIPQLYGVARSPAFIGTPKISPGEKTEDIPPPPKQEPTPRVSKGVTTGDAVTKVTPIYPTLARQTNVSGNVQVAITIDETGRVIEAKATSGHPLLLSAAEDAARKWVFRPTMLDGKPVKNQGVVVFVFVLPR